MQIRVNVSAHLSFFGLFDQCAIWILYSPHYHAKETKEQGQRYWLRQLTKVERLFFSLPHLICSFHMSTKLVKGTGWQLKQRWVFSSDIARISTKLPACIAISESFIHCDSRDPGSRLGWSKPRKMRAAYSFTELISKHKKQLCSSILHFVR